MCLLSHEMPALGFLVSFRWCVLEDLLPPSIPRGSRGTSSAGGGASLGGEPVQDRRAPCAVSQGRPPKEARRLPRLGPTVEEPAVFMQRCFQTVNDTGDV